MGREKSKKIVSGGVTEGLSVQEKRVLKSVQIPKKLQRVVGSAVTGGSAGDKGKKERLTVCKLTGTKKGRDKLKASGKPRSANIIS